MASERPSATSSGTTTESSVPPPVAPSTPSVPSTSPAITTKTVASDSTLGAISYLLPIIGVLILANTGLKSNPLLRRHAVQGIVLCAVLLPLSFIFTILPVIGCLTPIAWFAITGYYAYQVYQGGQAQIPGLTDFCTGQRWI